MKKSLLITAIALIVAGALLFTAALAALDFDFSKLSTENFQTNTYEISESFHRISIDVELTDITFAASDDGSCKIVCHETEKLKHSATVQDGTLVIKTANSRKWYDHIGIFTGGYKMTVYLPENEYISLQIRTDTGDVDLPDTFRFDNIQIESSTADIHCRASVASQIDIQTSTGTVTLSHVQCKRIAVDTDTGDVKLENCDADRMDIESDTGDVKLASCNADSIDIETDTGDVTGTLRSEMVFICETDTGRVKVPKTTSGGRCRISTDTGDIIINLE